MKARYLALNYDTCGVVVDTASESVTVSRHALISDAQAEAARLNAKPDPLPDVALRLTLHALRLRAHIQIGERPWCSTLPAWADTMEEAAREIARLRDGADGQR